MIFIFLTILTILSIIYSCDLPVLQGFEIFIHHSNLLYTISTGIIVSYIFYIFQVVIPQKESERKAYKNIEKIIIDYIENLTWLLSIYDQLCIFDNEKILIGYPKYAKYFINKEYLNLVEVESHL